MSKHYTHEIEFKYDGPRVWGGEEYWDYWGAGAGGTTISGEQVKSIIGREAFYDTIQKTRNFKVTMKITVELLKD